MNITLYRDHVGGVWRRIDANSDGTTTDMATSYSKAERAGDVVAIIRRANPGARVGVKASDIGPNVALACLMRGDGDVLWMKSA